MTPSLKKLIYDSALLCIALALSYLESLYSINLGGVSLKIGFANIIIIFILYRSGLKKAIAINTIRTALSSLLFGSLFTFAYSLAGAVASSLAMAAAKKIKGLGVIGNSVIGASVHNIAQLAVGCAFLGSFKLLLTFPILLFAGVISGIITGIPAEMLLKSKAAEIYEAYGKNKNEIN